MPDGYTPIETPQKSKKGQVPLAAVEVVGAGFRTFIRQALALLGLALIVIAIPIGFVTPFLPIGLPIAIVGVVLLGRNSIWGRRWMEGILSRYPKIERFAPNWLMKLVFGREKNVIPK